MHMQWVLGCFCTQRHLGAITGKSCSIKNFRIQSLFIIKDIYNKLYFLFFFQREAGEEICGVSVSCFLWWGCQSDPFQSHRTPNTRTPWKWHWYTHSWKIILIKCFFFLHIQNIKVLPPNFLKCNTLQEIIMFFCVCMLRATGRRREQLVAYPTGQQFLLWLFQCSFQSNDPFFTWHFLRPGQRPSQT